MQLRRIPYLSHAILIAMTVFMLYPIAWMVASSFKESSTVFVDAASLIPNQWNFDNYINGWKGVAGVTFTTFFANTFLVVGIATVGSVLSSAVIAYGFSRIRFRGRNIWFVCMMLTMLLPYEIVMVPQYILFNQFGWINTYLPLIVPTFFGTPFFVFLMMQFIRSIPYDLDEAAEIDGCNKFMTFVRIIMPLILPAMMTCVIFSFYWRWDDFLAPLLYLNKVSLYTVSLAIKMFSDPDNVTDWGTLFAMSTLSLIPVIVVFFVFQRYIVEGIHTSGLKG